MKNFEKFAKNNKPAKKPINEKWEKAKEFGDYVGLSTPFVLKLVKKYGERSVYGLRSWLKDAPRDKRFYGLVVWKLKQQESMSEKN